MTLLSAASPFVILLHLYNSSLLSYVSFQPALHSWLNKGRGMYYLVCRIIKDPLLLIEKIVGFLSRSVNVPLPYVRCHITNGNHTGVNYVINISHSSQRSTVCEIKTVVSTVKFANRKI